MWRNKLFSSAANNRLAPFFRLSCFAIFPVVAIVFASCATQSQVAERIPTETIPAIARPSLRLVIVLPGYGDTLDVMRKSGMAAVIQKNMPDATVLLVELSIPYYFEGHSAERLRREIVEPSRQRGFRDIYLAGASMGGMGVLTYERAYPYDTRGLILFAPYMGTDGADVLKEIVAAGGLEHWDAGSAHESVNGGSSYEQWRVVQSWRAHPERAHEVWLVCGQKDRFRSAATLIASALPADHYISPPGGHGWKVWTQGAGPVFAAIESEKPRNAGISASASK